MNEGRKTDDEGSAGCATGDMDKTIQAACTSRQYRQHAICIATQRAKLRPVT